MPLLMRHHPEIRSDNELNAESQDAPSMAGEDKFARGILAGRAHHRACPWCGVAVAHASRARGDIVASIAGEVRVESIVAVLKPACLKPSCLSLECAPKPATYFAMAAAVNNPESDGPPMKRAGVGGKVRQPTACENFRECCRASPRRS